MPGGRESLVHDYPDGYRQLLRILGMTGVEFDKTAETDYFETAPTHVKLTLLFAHFVIEYCLLRAVHEPVEPWDPYTRGAFSWEGGGAMLGRGGGGRPDRGAGRADGPRRHGL